MSNKTQLQQNNVDLAEIKEAINALPDALDTTDANATAADIVTGKTAYVNGKKITGTGEVIDTSTLRDITVTQYSGSWAYYYHNGTEYVRITSGNISAAKGSMIFYIIYSRSVSDPLSAGVTEGKLEKIDSVASSTASYGLYKVL